MSEERQSFSKRHGLQPQGVPITIQYEAPEWLRDYVITVAQECQVGVHDQREKLCRMTFDSPDPNNWSGNNVEWEVRSKLAAADWYVVYDFVEEISKIIDDKADHEAAEEFSEKINTAFRRRGVGWKLESGRIELRGEEAFEKMVGDAEALAEETGRTVANQEIHEALKDLSRRPASDVTGAIQHAGAALECVARDVTGRPKATLGEIVKECPDKFPSPIDQAVDKVWGYVSEMGRHLRENRPPHEDEAHLVVGLAAAISVYLMKKASDSEVTF